MYDFTNHLASNMLDIIKTNKSLYNELNSNYLSYSDNEKYQTFNESIIPCFRNLISKGIKSNYIGNSCYYILLDMINMFIDNQSYYDSLFKKFSFCLSENIKLNKHYKICPDYKLVSDYYK